MFVLKSKNEIRKILWDLLEEKNVVTFPQPVYGRIPNFIGANVASEKLEELSVWRKARVIKSNPDSPQKWVRENALIHGKIVYIAVPRLREEKCFLKINPKKVQNITEASTIKGAFKYGEKVLPEDMKKIDLIIIGSVGVNDNGAKIGKGGGFSDIEYAMGREFGIVDDSTPTITTIHELQLTEINIPMSKHDVPIDYIVMRNKIIKTNTDYKKPEEIYWDILGEKIKEIPILQRIKKL